MLFSSFFVCMCRLSVHYNVYCLYLHGRATTNKLFVTGVYSREIIALFGRIKIFNTGSFSECVSDFILYNHENNLP